MTIPFQNLDSDSNRDRPLRLTVVALVVVVASGAALGGLTSLGQLYLPPWISSLANSAGGWTAITFILVRLMRARPVWSAIAGVAVFEALVMGYGLVSELRGYFFAAPFTSVWNGIGLLAGPVVGVSASLLHGDRRTWSVLAVVPVAAVLIGEGVRGLLVLHSSTSAVYWTIQLAAGAAIVAIVLTRRRPQRRALLATMAGTVLGAGALFAAFALAGT